jgi:transcriptional regulator with AAA-type ATPase domain
MSNSEQESPLLQFVGTSASIQRARELAALTANSDVPVLIRGEPGVGKMHLARCIASLPWNNEGREAPTRKAEVDFALFNANEMVDRIVGTMVAQEESFTTSARGFLKPERERFRPGALFSRRLIVRNLQKATPQMQAYLLTALRDHTVRDPSGRTHELDRPWQLIVLQRPDEEDVLPDVSRALASGVVIDLPPLRDRPDDIEALATHFLRTREYQLELPADVIEQLRQHSFPENVRELFNILDRTLLQLKGRPLTTADLIFPSTSQGRVLGGVTQLNKQLAELRAQLEELHTSSMPAKPIWEGRRFSTRPDEDSGEGER